MAADITENGFAFRFDPPNTNQNVENSEFMSDLHHLFISHIDSDVILNDLLFLKERWLQLSVSFNQRPHLCLQQNETVLYLHQIQ